MPLQRFKPVSGSCKLCHGSLEIRLSSGDATPANCPKCGQAIEPQVAAFAKPARIHRKPSVSEAKSAGFKVLKRLGRGEYEEQ